MDKKQTLASFQELTTTELNLIIGGLTVGRYSYIALNIIKHNNTKIII